MPLQFQTIPITFVEGLDTKTDFKTGLQTKLLELQNGVFTHKGSISKRFGYDELSTNIDGGDHITSGVALSTYKDELLCFDGSRVYSRLNATERWADRGQAISVIVSSDPVIANGYEQSNPVLCVSSSGIEVYAWEDSRGHIRYSVLDTATRAFIVSDGIVSTTGTHPRAAALGNYVLVFFADSGSLKYRAINITQPSVLDNEVVFTTALDPDAPHFDIVNIGKRIYVASTTYGGGTDVNYITSNLDIGGSVAHSSSDATQAISCWSDSSQNIWIACVDSDTVSVYVLTYLLWSMLSTTVVDAIANIDNISGVATSSTTSTLFYTISADNDINYYVRKSTITSTGTTGTPSVFARSVGLASKPFMYNETLHLNVSYASNLQATIFTLDADATVIAKMHQMLSGGHRSNNTLSSVAEPSTGVFRFAATKKGRLISEDVVEDGYGQQINKTGLFTLNGVVSHELNFDSSNQFISCTLGDNLYIVGGIVQSYDGVQATEANFNLYPDSDGISLVANTPTPADTTAPTVTITGVA